MSSEKESKSEDDSGAYGKKFDYDPDFRGPIHDRSCTDILCLILFLACIGGLVVVSCFAYYNGKPEILIHPTDSRGNLCGLKKMVTRPYLFFFDLTLCGKSAAVSLMKGCPTTQICLEKCPDKNWYWKTALLENTVSDAICQDGIDPTRSGPLSDLVTQGKCAPYYFNSTSVSGRCVPNLFLNAVRGAQSVYTFHGVNLSNTLNETITGSDLQQSSKTLSTLIAAVNVGQKVVSDLAASWWKILIMLIFAALLSLIWCGLMRCAVSILVYTTYAIFFFGFAGGALFSFYQYERIKTNEAKGGTVKTFNDNLSRYTENKDFWMWIGILCTFLAVIIGILFLCLRSRIALAIAILEETGKAVSSISSSLFFPLIPFLFEVIVIVYIISVIVYLKATVKSSQIFGDLPNGTNCSSQHLDCRFYQYNSVEWANYVVWYTVFMGFWLLCFVVGMGQITLAGAFASWYWAWEKPRDIPTFPIASSGLRALRYHTGSVAFGSLLIAIVMFIRVVLEFLQRQLSTSQNKVAAFFFCILRCCFWCLESILRFITKNAFIMIAIHGKCFCIAAKDGFFLVMRNCLRLLVLDNVTGFILFVGKLIVAALVGVSAYFAFKTGIPLLEKEVMNLHYFYVPVIVCILGSWFVASLFFDVYGFAVDTLFFCVMEDLERNDGSPDKPYFMSKDLMEVLGTKNDPVPVDGKEKSSGCLFCC
jgi:solute carrier family 44 (choline transporter-like protein), member 2/4/5